MRLHDLSSRTILIGLALSAGVFIAIRYIFSPIWDPVIRTVFVLSGAILGAMAGGYYTSRQPIYRVMLHVGLVAVLNVVLLIVLRLLPVNPLLIGGMLAAALLGAFIGQRAPISAVGTPFAGGRSYSARGYTTNRASVWSRVRMPIWARRLWDPFRRMINQREAGQLYDQLLRRTRMDQDLADRLIDFERRRTPYANRAALIRSALERLDRDNR